MRAFGFVLVLIGAMIIYLGWQGKTWPAFQALFNLAPGTKGSNNGFTGSSGWANINPQTGQWDVTPGL